MSSAGTREQVTRDFITRLVRLNWHLPACPKASVYTLPKGEVAVCECRLEYLASVYGISIEETKNENAD